MFRESDPACAPRPETGRGKAFARLAWMRLFPALLLLAGLAAAGPYDTWGKYKTLIINTTNTSGGANVANTVSNIPILIRLINEDADDILSEALSGGADVRFSSSDGSTALSYQIEKWTNSSSAAIWVLVPSVAGNSTTNIRIYWKKAGQADASAATTVFSTSNGFAGVWHLTEAGSNTVGDYKDATGTTDNTAAAGMTAAGAGQVTGVIGNATAFDGSTSRLGFGTVPGSTSAHTISFWMKADALDYMSVVDKVPNDGSGVGWTFKARNDGSMWYRVGSETNSSDWVKAGVYSAGNWVYVTGTFSGGTQNFYYNGAAAGSAITGVTKTVNNTTTNLRFGIPSSAVTTEIFDGALDEVQIHSSARDQYWVKLSYETQKASSTCISFGTTTPTSSTYYWNPPGSNMISAQNWSINADGTGRRPVSTSDDDFTADALSGWTYRETISDGGSSSSLTANADQLTLAGHGGDVFFAANQYTSIYRTDITSDFDVQVKIVSQSAADVWSKSGIMMADNITSLSSGGFAIVAVTPGNGYTFQYDISGNVGELETEVHTSSSPAVTFPCWLRLTKVGGTSVSAYYKTSSNGAWTQIGTAQTPQSMAADSHIALFSTAHTGSVTCTAVFDEFQSGKTLSSSSLDLSFSGTGTTADGNCGLYNDLPAASVDFTNYTGTFTFSGGALTINSGNATFGAGMTIALVNGTLAFTGNSGTQTFTPKNGATFPDIAKSGASGTLAIATNALTAGDITLTSGTWQWGAGLTHAVASITTTAGTMDFGSSTVQVNTGDANLSGLGTLTIGTGTLAFTASSGTQTFTPKSGATHPTITKSNAGQVTVATNGLTTGSYTINASGGTWNWGSGLTHTLTAAPTLSGGTWDFGSSTVQVSAGNVNTTSLAGITPGTGTLAFTGNSGTQTLTPKSATTHPGIAKSGASGTLAFATNALNAGAVTLTSGTWSWGAGFTHSVASMTTAAGTMDFGSSIVQVNTGSCDLSGLATLTIGTGTLAFTASSGTQTFTPKSAATSPTITKSNAGQVTVATNALTTASFTLNASGGTWNWGAGLTHVITAMTLSGGTMDFGSSTVQTPAATVNFNSLTTVTAGTGTLEFTATSGTQTFTPKASQTHPGVKISGVGGTVAVATNALTAGGFTQTAGTWQWGTGFTHAVSSITTSAGVMDFGSSIVQVNSGNANLSGLATLTIGTGTLAFTANSGTQTFTPKSGATSPTITKTGASGTVLVSTNPLTTASFTLTSGTWQWGAGLTHVLTAMTTAAGVMDFGSSIVQVSSGDVNLTGLTTVTAGTGTLAFTGNSGTQTFTPKASQTHPAITKSGASGTVAVATNALTAGAFTLTSGIWQWGAGFTHAVASISTAAGTLDFGSSTVQVTSGDANLSSLGTLTIGTGTLAFTANSGTQTFTPKSGANSPIITKSGASGTVAVSTNPVTTSSFTLTSGTWQWGAGLTHVLTAMTTAAGVMDFGSSIVQVSSGNVSLTGLTTVTAGTGTLAFTGNSGTQTFTPKASQTHPTITKSGASGTVAVATNALTTASFTLTSGTWQWGAGMTHVLTAMTTAAGVMDFGSSIVQVGSGNVDLSGLTTVTAGTGTLAFTGNSGTQTFTPKASQTHPAITKSGASGTVAVSTNALTAAAFTLTSGTWQWGAGFTHSVTSISTAAGVMDFGSSIVQVSSGDANLNSLTTVTAGTGTLAFTGNSGTQTFTPKASQTHPAITKSGASGTVAVATNALTAGAFTLTSGTWQWGAGFTHSVTSISTAAGTMDFGSSTVQVSSGDANLSGLTTLTAGTGTLAFTGNSGTQTFTPKASQTHPTLTKSGASGTVAVSTNSLTAGAFTLTSGTWQWGAGMTHAVTSISTAAGTLDFGSSTVQVTSGNANLSSLATLTIGTGTLAFTANSGTQTFTPKSGATSPTITKSGASGTVAVATNPLTTASFTLTSGTWQWGAGLTHVLTAMTTAAGVMDFGSSIVQVSSGNVDLSGLTTVTAGTGTLAFTGNSGTQTFTPKASQTHPAITKSGASGTVAVATNGLTTGVFTLTSGTWQWGTGLTHSVTSISTAAGTLDFGTSTVQVTSGNANLSGLSALTAGTGTLAFTGTSGTQVLTPASGLSAPNLTHTGASTLQLSTNALACLSFSQSAGILDFNSVNITVSGAFTLTNGTTTSLTNLNGRTLTVTGNASFAGQSGNLLNLNASAWTLTVSGSLTADYATLAGSNASGGTQGIGTNCVNAGSNTNWYFGVSTTLANLRKNVRLHFNTTSSGANVTGNVANIPILVRFSSSNLTFSSTTATGTDLLFVDKDGTTLYHQVVEWDKANQTGKVWVRVPQVDGNSSADYVTAYYGCDSCNTNSYSRSDLVWAGYAGVYHLNAPERQASDAGANAYHGTYQQNLPNAAGVTSTLAPVFNGTSDYITTTCPTNVGTRTLSSWIYPTGSNNVAEIESVIDGEVATEFGNGFGLDNAYIKVLLDNQYWTTNQSVSLNAWQHVLVRFNATKAVLYYNGLPVDSTTYVQGALTSATYKIGKSNANALYFRGMIDEVQVLDAYASTDYAKLAYENQKSNSALFTYLTASSFQNSKVFKLNTTASGANVSGNVTNFPMLLRLTGVSSLGVTGSGTTVPTDIRFRDDDSLTWLDYEVERWDRTGGIDSAEVWVRVPIVRGNSNSQTITMYYRQATGYTIPDGQCASCVFKPANGFVGAWHMNTSGTGARPDASGNGLTLATNNYAGSELKGGIIAGADSLNGTNQYLSIASGLADWSTGFTYTGWAWWASNASASRLFDFGNGAASDNLWAGRNASTATTFSTEIYNNTTSGGIKSATSAIATGVWGHFAVTYNGTTVKIYKNGSLVSNTVSTQSLRNITRTSNYLGRSNAAAVYFTGKFDELALANVDRDSNWIKLAYQNQRRDSTFIFNPSPSDFLYTKKLPFNTTKTGANVTNNVTNYPLLVRLTDANAGLIDAVQNSYQDIRFLDADGVTWLNYWVERWSKAQDSAEVWVMVPQVDGNSDHDYITLYYGQNGVTVPDGQCRSCVFGSYKLAYHLNESPGASAPQFADASGNANNGTAQNGVTADSIGAAIGKGFKLNGYSARVSGTNYASSKYVSTATSFASPGPGTFTGSIWFKTNRNAYDSGGALISFGSTQSDDQVSEDRHLWMLTNGKMMFACYPGTYQETPQTASAYNDGNWHQAAIRLSNSTYSGQFLFMDGVQVATLPNTSAQAFTGYWRAGRGKAGGWPNSASILTEAFNGTVDEFRIAHSELSNDVIKLDYETQRPTGNVFWGTRLGPNNTAVLTATATSTGNIALSWPSSVSDSSTADSVGIWVKYSGYPDSVGVSGATFVAKLAKTDTTYAYPASYSATYYFALAVRNTSGKWSPFTSTSSASVAFTGTSQPDTLYVDSAIGNNANSCAAAQNPSTPKLTITNALTCGASATDTLVVRVMPGSYYDSAFSITSKPSIVTSFDNNSRAVMNGAGSGTVDGVAGRLWTLLLYGNMGIRNLDVKCLLNGYAGVFVSSADNIFVEGCRILPKSSSYRHNIGIYMHGGGNSQRHFANNLIYQPIYYGFLTDDDNSFNFVNNVVVGDGSSGSVGFQMANNASAADMTLSNNIFVNWDYGLSSYTPNIGSCASNLFFGVTTGHNITTTTCTGTVTTDPLFANTTPTDRNAFKLLPGSPGIDAGSSTYGSGAEAVTRRTPTDFFGTARPQGTAPDIGLYEGTGYTTNPTGEFDSLTVSSTATTVTVQNSKWKLVWDQARGAGINGFYDKTTNAATNLLATNSLLFDAKIDGYQASAQTAAGPLLYLVQSSRARAVVRQRLGVSGSLDLNIYYSVYPSGHVYIESELANLAAVATTVGTVDFTLKLGTVVSAYTSAGTNNGYGYLLTSTRDVGMAVTRDLDGGASGAETWATSTAASGSPGTLVFNTADLADLSRNTVRRHDFALYLGDNSLNLEKTAAISQDAYAPSRLTLSAGSLLMERSWQDNLAGHWTFDDGGGASARDKAVFQQNNATLTGSGYRWGTGKVGGGIYLTAADVATVASAANLEGANGFTLMFWWKPDFTGMGDTALIVGKGVSSAGGWYCRKASGVNKIQCTMGAATVTSPTLTDGAWTHIALLAVSGGNGNLEMYVNGAQAAASTAAATIVTGANDLLFGYSAGSAAEAKFQGTLDDIRIYRKEVAGYDIQSIYNGGFSSRYGHYAVRADNNNRVVAVLNGGAAQTRVQPAFYIANWYGPRNPKYVYLNGTKLAPNTEYTVDSVVDALSGGFLTLQLNKVLTGADQTLFIDDDDSAGFMGTATAMKALSITATANDKIAIKNFSDTVFGGATSGQWYMELDLNGWATPTRSTLTDSGFGEINAWKAAAVSPSLAISSAYQMVGWGANTGRSLSYLKLDATGAPNETYTAGTGYQGPANNTYTLVDSSSTRLSLTMSADSLIGEGHAAVVKRFTFYPTGRVFVSYQVRNQDINFDAPRLDLNPRYDGLNPATSWSTTLARDSARWAFIGGSANYHSIGLAMLSVNNATSTYTSGAAMLNSAAASSAFGASNDQRTGQFTMPTSLWTSANKPVTVNFMMDFSKDFADSATADSLLRDVQHPAVLAEITGTRVTGDPLDFNIDNFAEGDGAYTYAASSGIAHFKFTNTVTSFYPAFRISVWTEGVLPEFVILDNQVLTKGYHYNAFLKTASNEVVIQLNKTLAPGTHVIFISHKSGLAVRLNRFAATGGDGVDTLAWTTESEFENLGFHVWRREIPSDSAAAKDAARFRDSLLTKHGAGDAAAADGATAKASAITTAGDSAAGPDTLPSVNLSAEERAKLGFVRITPKLIPGARGGSSASTREYLHVDRTAAFGKAYEYLLEAIDFNDGHVFYGPRAASPGNPYNTEILPNYPNPFNPITTLRFSLREKLKVSLVVYDARGRVVRTLLRPDKPMAAGKYTLIWDAHNDMGMEVPSGQYFYRFTAGRYVKARKMILLK